MPLLLQENNCSAVLVASPDAPPAPARAPKAAHGCAYQGQGPMLHCGLFGDPHIKVPGRSESKRFFLIF